LSLTEFQERVRSLSLHLASTPAPSGCAEERALQLLQSVLQTMETPIDRRLLDLHIQALQRFWLQSVGWCSPLSKQLERIISDYEELN
jgi:hypothetical protein